MPPAGHTHATLAAGTGLSGGSYNGGAAATFAVTYGTAAGTAVQGNQTATITAGTGLSGGISGDALGDGFAATLNVGGGSGITANADSLALGPLTANWSQTGAYDVVLGNAASELQILESAGATYYGTFDVGDLSANQTYTFGTGGTVWTSGNDGADSTLDADLLDGVQGSGYQARVSGTCAVGSSIRAINADGTVTCEAQGDPLHRSTPPQGNSITTVDATDNVGEYTSITIGADGLPVVSYFDGGPLHYDLKVLHCGNAACTPATRAAP